MSLWDMSAALSRSRRSSHWAQVRPVAFWTASELMPAYWFAAALGEVARLAVARDGLARAVGRVAGLEDRELAARADLTGMSKCRYRSSPDACASRLRFAGGAPRRGIR